MPHIRRSRRRQPHGATRHVVEFPAQRIPGPNNANHHVILHRRPRRRHGRRSPLPTALHQHGLGRARFSTNHHLIPTHLQRQHHRTSDNEPRSLCLLKGPGLPLLALAQPDRADAPRALQRRLRHVVLVRGPVPHQPRLHHGLQHHHLPHSTRAALHLHAIHRLRLPETPARGTPPRRALESRPLRAAHQLVRLLLLRVRRGL